MAELRGPSLIRRWAPVRNRSPGTGTDCWFPWDAWEIARQADCPLDAVQAHWPAICAELHARQIAQPEVVAAAIATVAIETAHTFAPVEEAFWMDDGWRWANLRYAPYWGRGYIQLTWDYNYQTYGDALGFDLLGIPNLALVPEVSAAIFAEYFSRAAVAEAALRQDWREVRRRVQGADAGLAELLQIVSRLGFMV